MKRDIKHLWRYIGNDSRREGREEPNFRIRFFAFCPFIRSRLLPALKYIVLVLLVSFAACLGFAILYKQMILGSDLKISLAFSDFLSDSILIFESFASFSVGGELAMLSSGYEAQIVDLLQYVVLAERIAGVLANAILMASVVAVAMRPTNPIWLCPKLVLDTSQYGKERLSLRYWVKYREGRLLYDCTCMVRFQSDRAARSIDRSTEIDSRHVEQHLTRRGAGEVNLGFDDLHEDFAGKPNGPSRKSCLARMLLARYGEVGKTYQVRFGSYEETMFLSGELKRRYADYHILFRVSGVTNDGKHVSSEIKYRIEDVLFGFTFRTIEEVESLSIGEGSEREGIQSRRYSYRFGNIWHVARCAGSERPVDLDVEGIDATSFARACFREIAADFHPFADGDREVTPTATIRTFTPARKLSQRDIVELKDLLGRSHGLHSHKDMIEGNPREHLENVLREAGLVFDARSQAGAQSAGDPSEHGQDGESAASTPSQAKVNAFICVARVGDGGDVDVDGECSGRIVGFQLFLVPRNTEENLAYDIGLSDAAAERVILVDLSCVHPDYRGQELQYRMIGKGQEHAIRSGRGIFLAQVDPQNEHSMNNFLTLGYHREKTFRDAHGHAKEILMRRFRDMYTI